jgi:hypothetical protein
VVPDQPVLPVDPGKCAPYPFYMNPIFVCVDVEAWERNNDVITEIGVSFLDTQDIAAVQPGQDGENWARKINTQHFRIDEYAHHVNHQFVLGCPDKFEFGKSEFISVKDAAKVVAACFQLASWHQTSLEPRNLILVGHDIAHDIAYLRKIGFDVMTLPNLYDRIDTSVLHKAWKRNAQPRSLSSMLLDLGMTAWNLHNAGNDAHYTMQCMLGISFRETSAQVGPSEVIGKPEEAKENMDTSTNAIKTTNEDYKERMVHADQPGEDVEPHKNVTVNVDIADLRERSTNSTGDNADPNQCDLPMKLEYKTPPQCNWDTSDSD